MVDEVLEGQEALGLVNRPEILTADTGYGSGHFVSAMLEREILPHIPLLARGEMEEIPTWKRKTSDLGRMRVRKQKMRHVEARNRVRELMRTRGYQVSRKLRIRSEHVFAEAKGRHGLGRARRRGLERVQAAVRPLLAPFFSAILGHSRLITAFLGVGHAPAQHRHLARPSSRGAPLAHAPG